ncbi:MAG: ankyrin repeat domain-containing protein [Lentisphaeria bacterium]|jgi:ankyrin repeat protein
MRISCILLLFLVSSAWATMQISDKVFFAGDEYEMGDGLYSHSEIFYAARSRHYPLGDYLGARELSFGELFPEWTIGWCSACWRGYVATWDIQDGVLRLVNLAPFGLSMSIPLAGTFLPNPSKDGEPQTAAEGVRPGSRLNEPIPIERLDPTWRYPVVADWYSGDFYLTKRNYLSRGDIAFYHLVFSKGRLTRMKELNTLSLDLIRHSESLDERLSYWPSAVRKINYCKLLDEKASDELIKKVLSLRRGASVAAVNSRLGPPDSSAAADDGLRQRYYLSRIDPQREDPLDLALEFVFVADALDAIRVVMGDEDAFMRPVDRELLQAGAAGDLAKVREKLAAGADVGARNNAGDSALTLAMREEQLAVFRLLVEQGAPVDITEPQLPLDFALSQQDYALARYLIEQRGVDVNALDTHNDFSVLCYAAGRGDVEALRFLLERGACVMVDGRPLPKLLELAIGSGSLESLKLLVAAGGIEKDEYRHQYLPLSYACLTGNLEIVHYLLTLGADARNSDALATAFQRTLATACQRTAELIPILLEHGADPNHRCDSSRIPAWMLLVRSVDDGEQLLAMLRLFEHHGADFTLRDQHGGCGLHHAAGWNCPAAIEFLLAKGLPVNVKDHYGETPLYRAARDGCDKSIMALLAAGADAATCNDEGENALHLRFMAHEAPSLSVVQALIAAGAKPHARRKVRDQPIGPIDMLNPGPPASSRLSSLAIQAGDQPIDVLNYGLRGEMWLLARVMLQWTQVPATEKMRKFLNRKQANINAWRRVGDYLLALPPE